MKILVVLGHPNPSSFNHAIAETAVRELGALGHQVIFHDLCQEAFDPLLTTEEIPDDGPISSEIERYCQELRSADGIVIVHPNWWGQPPAILKGWIDRVFRAGIAYEFLEGDGGEGVPHGLLKASRSVVFNTSNTEANREETVFGDPLERIWKDCIFDLCGVKQVDRKMYRIVITSTDEERQQWLRDVKSVIQRNFPEE